MGTRLTSSRAEAALYLARGVPSAAVEAVIPAVAWPTSSSVTGT